MYGPPERHGHVVTGKAVWSVLGKAASQSLACAGCSIRVVSCLAVVALPKDSAVAPCFGCDVGSLGGSPDGGTGNSCGRCVCVGGVWQTGSSWESKVCEV